MRKEKSIRAFLLPSVFHNPQNIAMYYGAFVEKLRSERNEHDQVWVKNDRNFARSKFFLSEIDNGILWYRINH